MEGQNNTTKQIVMWVVFAIVVVLVGGYLIFKGKGSPFKESQEEQGISGGAAIQNETSTIPAPGASVITESGEVISVSGKPADNAAIAGSESAPSQSQPIAKEQIPKGTIKLEVTADGGFKPDSFTVRSGDPVVLSLTGLDDKTHVLRFDDPSLSGVVIGIGPGMTRLVPFNAPQTPGEYAFRDEVPGNVGVGKMIVK